MKAGKNGAGIETTGALISEPVQFPVPLPVQSHRTHRAVTYAQQLWGGAGPGYPPQQGMTALCTPLADRVDPPQPTTAPPSPLTPFKITTEASADREDKVVQGTESSARFPGCLSHSSRTEHEGRAIPGPEEDSPFQHFLTTIQPVDCYDSPSPILLSSKLRHHLPGSNT